MAQFRGNFEPEKVFKGTDSGTGFRKGAYGSQPESHAAFAGMIKQLDDYVGEIIASISELGLEKNTIVIFSSDNGPHLEGGADPDYFNSNGKFKGYKRDLYEGGIRVPFIVRWPGKVKQGRISDHVSAFWDIMPTFAEAAGIDAPEETDGISFLPELLGRKQKDHEFLYWEFHEQGGRIAVRTGNWKAVKFNTELTDTGQIELYNLSVDPGETNDVAGSNPEVVKEMLRIMKREHVPSDIFPMAAER